MPNIHTVDLHFLGESAAIAAFAIEDADGLTLVECGPFSTHDHLLAGLSALGFRPEEVHTLLLSHIHFDHAGAAWWWAQQGTHVYVHPRGLKHMLDPTRLYGSAARIYGEDNMERLWGRMERIAPDQISAVEDRAEIRRGGNTWIAHHTPGHASHHIAWQLGDQVFTGDVGGVCIKGGPVVPPCPPPDINVEEWTRSIERLKRLGASHFHLTHYGAVAAGSDHLDQLAQRLTHYVNYVKTALASGQTTEAIVPGFTNFVEDELRAAGVGEETIGAYRVANPPYMSVAGIARWLDQAG
ncbi:MBL fold metallo-hydrolase [Neolewinella lacunae]|uniref:MBL fold metallo-hydrolase n=1 Tax=Neolewinella lacunae TaxID=1517758 RepID=A0A923T811_9BACT|nr:MBL fold metallo-hydrolase [Neolewinella lacunae]MBC6993463.1 MBL fold metallo-hydrolase [Neolewinella lacunae]MDN3636261.1 MBL fold metallo-hydrolase [Neolewinella lacunae]